MDQFFTTLIIAFMLILFAICLLAIGWLITGTSKFRGNQCGKAPNRKKGNECGTDSTCPLCEGDKKKPTEEPDERLQ